VVRGTQSKLEFEMPGEDPAQFPDFPSFAGDNYHEITAGTLREMIRRTVFATADERGRYTMTGVLWELEDNKVHLVGTDGRRLAKADGLATQTGEYNPRGQTPVVPTKAMKLLESNLQDDPEGGVRVCLRPNEVLFRTGRAEIYSRLVEGRFPDYRAVMPKKAAVQVEVQAAPFQAAVRQAAIMTDKDTKRVTFQFERGKLTLHSAGATAGRSKIELPLDYDARPIDINFNPDFLIDVLKVLPPDETLRLDLIGDGDPALFRCGDNYLYLVMPVT
jgi:DNA polymerase-3 subunit beta